MYRRLGNGPFRFKHSVVTPIDIEQGRWLLNIITEHRLSEGKILELGTGWTHFYSLFLRCFLDAELVLYDIQDNRNLKCFKERAEGLSKLILAELDSRDERIKDRLLRMDEMIATADSFSSIYNGLNMKYLIAPKGDLGEFKENEFDAIFSMDVLEHIPESQLEENVPSLYRMLKPGGLFLHQIGIDDHIAHYAPRLPRKNYLRYSERVSRLFLSNSVQYHNHLQADDYLRIIKKGRFELSFYELDKDSGSVPAKISSDYLKYPKEIIEAVRARMVFYK